jgi:hypothetical protein
VPAPDSGRSTSKSFAPVAGGASANEVANFFEISNIRFFSIAVFEARSRNANHVIQ